MVRSHPKGEKFLLTFTDLFCLFRAAPAAHGSSQARSRIRATAASLRPKHNLNYHLHHSSQQRQILNLLSEARDQTCVFTDTSWVFTALSHNRNSYISYFLFTYFSWLHQKHVEVSELGTESELQLQPMAQLRQT